MHQLAIALVALAGGAYCLAAWQRWRSLGREAGEGAASGEVGEVDARRAPLVWVGFGLHTAALAASFGAGRDLLYAVLGVWAAIAAVLFAARFIAGPSRGLLALPIGCIALVLAMAAAAGGPDAGATAAAVSAGGAVTVLHAAAMSAYLAAMLVAGSAGVLYLIADRSLKSASPRALRLPALPALGHLCERSLIVATALLMTGVATVGAAIEQTPGGTLAQPPVAIGLANLVLLVLVLAGRAMNRIGRRGIARASALCLGVGGVLLVSTLVAPHG